MHSHLFSFSGLCGAGAGVFDVVLASFYLANMSDALEAATGAAKLFLEFSNVTIDNTVFKLFYRGTTSVLVIGSILATSKQVFGDPISCGVVSIIVKDIFLPFYGTLP